MNINDQYLVNTAVADRLYKDTADTTDATPVTVRTYTLTASELLIVEVICAAMKDTTGAFVSRMAKSFFYDGVTVQEGGWWGYITKEYFGTGLSTCDFDIVADGADVSVVWTGEAGASITANFKISIQNMLNEAPLP